MDYFETSAASGLRVAELFQDVSAQVVEKIPDRLYSPIELKLVSLLCIYKYMYSTNNDKLIYIYILIVWLYARSKDIK